MKFRRFGNDMAIIAVRAQGLPYASPESYSQFLKSAKAIPNRTGLVPGSFAWRGRNRPSALNCKLAFATSDSDYTDFGTKLLDGQDGVIVSRIFGAARRRTLLWRRRVEARSVQLLFASPQDKHLEWDHYTSRMITEIDKFDQVSEDFNPVGQLRLFQEISRYYKQSDVDRESASELIDFENLFEDIEYAGNVPLERQRTAATISDRSAWIFCIVRGSRKQRTSADNFFDDWRFRPVILSEVLGNEDEVSSDTFIDLAFVSERINSALDENSLLRFTRSLEHFAVHLKLLQHARNFVSDWWGPLLQSPSWIQKENASGNFLRAWQHFCLEIEPLWALGRNDKQIDPAVIMALDKATGLTTSWQDANRRLGNLLQLSTQVIGDGDPSIHLDASYGALG
ncbi:hypothetical protein ACFFUB_05660 [Algimonas porphyrae]|uniref:hypothetical protein n=1 Tax=Algimonas porphyrae TaxID=1128113 RepID=UPI0024E0DA18|nr:hypothetical protein [Algimonas porphyrae]